ncbi:GNAT family N-acetyltransferase [Ruminococcaceae bacterium OttesenSCG-928-D13]|nr:GNAT family N-acetyltransferase [Ruminococcaceae bacterium OttesenSCG-928-D13]
MILETPRLLLREVTPDDRDDLALILQDAETMTYYEHLFTDEEVLEWLDRQIARYAAGFGLWAVALKEGGGMIGQCGLTWQDWDGDKVLEVGYLLNRAHWHRGYAAEAARACRDYAFQSLGAETVYSIIRVGNIASIKVAQRNGMRRLGGLVKHYYGIDMPHEVWGITRREAGF